MPKKRFKSNKVYSEKTLGKLVIDYELRRYGKTIEDVKDDPKWLDKYTFDSYEEHLNWLQYCSKLLRKHYKPWYISKRRIREEVQSLDLMFGLKCSYNVNLSKLYEY